MTVGQRDRQKDPDKVQIKRQTDRQWQSNRETDRETQTKYKLSYTEKDQDKEPHKEKYIVVSNRDTQMKPLLLEKHFLEKKWELKEKKILPRVSKTLRVRKWNVEASKPTQPKGVFPVTDNCVFKGPLGCSLHSLALSTHFFCRAPLCRAPLALLAW